jgi:hypothetical protein
VYGGIAGAGVFSDAAAEMLSDAAAEMALRARFCCRKAWLLAIGCIISFMERVAMFKWTKFV